MSKLIAKSSNLYRKRLVRELNSLPDGLFYASVATFKVRCNRAKYSKGVITCHSLACAPTWFIPSAEVFEDNFGREVCASREGGAK